MKLLFNTSILIISFVLVFIIAEFFYNLPSNAFNKFRYYTVNGGGENCIKKFGEYSSDFKSIGSFENGKCRVKNAVRISSFKTTDLSSDLILTCSTALKVAKYFNEIEAKYIKHMGSYNCRTVANSKIMSEHSYGTAIDISHIDDASVKVDWNENTKKGKFLRKAYKVACKYFSNVMTPNTNKSHLDHFHFDNGYGTQCFK